MNNNEYYIIFCENKDDAYGPLFWETQLKNATIEKCEKKINQIAGKYGETRICKVSILETNDIGAIFSVGASYQDNETGLTTIEIDMKKNNGSVQQAAIKVHTNPVDAQLICNTLNKDDAQLLVGKLDENNCIQWVDWRDDEIDCKNTIFDDLTHESKPPLVSMPGLTIDKPTDDCRLRLTKTGDLITYAKIRELPLGSRFRYKNTNEVYVLINKSDCGICVRWKDDYMINGKEPIQEICSVVAGGCSLLDFEIEYLG